MAVWFQAYARAAVALIVVAAGAAVQAEPQAEAPPTVESALEKLKSKEPFERSRGAIELMEFGEQGAAAIPRLIELLCDDEYEGPWDPSDRISSFSRWTLMKMGRKAEEALLAQLERPEDEPRERAAQLLGEMKSERAIEPLLKRLKQPGAVVAWGAADALGAMKVRSAVEPLVSLLGSSDPKTARNAARALGAIGDQRAIDPLIASLAASDAETRRNAAWALATIGDGRAIEPLTRLVEREPIDDVGEHAIEALLQLDGEGTAAAVALLKHEQPRVRRRAASMLKRYERAELIDPLLQALRDPDPEVAGSAAGGLFWIVKHRGVEPVVQAFAMKKAPHEVRRCAMCLIAESSVANKESLLIEGLSDESAEVRGIAAKGLAKLKSAAAVKPLVAAWQATPEARDNFVRATIIESLGVIGGEGAFDGVVAAIDDKTSLVRDAAAKSLGRLQDPRAVPLLLDMLDDKDLSAKCSALQSLARFDDPRVAPTLIAALQRRGDESTQSAAAWALAGIKDKCVDEALVDALEDAPHSVRTAVINSLARRDPTTVGKALVGKFGAERARDWQTQVDNARAFLKGSEQYR